MKWPCEPPFKASLECSGLDASAGVIRSGRNLTLRQIK